MQLQQVLLNLVLNAADALSHVNQTARELSIRTEAHEAGVRLCVADNGPGIPPQHLESVFHPFWSTKADGMGMGLAISQTIIANHSGTITASNNAGRGATFCVTLPAKKRR